MSVEEFCDEDDKNIFQEQLIRTKGKCKTYSRQKEIFVDVKLKRRAGKCLGAGQLELAFASAMDAAAKTETTAYSTISNDIWYHVSEHIPPEEVRTFALICRQTADTVNSRKFWMHLYKHYCSAAAENEWKSQLPERLQLDTLRSCDTKTLRARVIEALFYCYNPFVERLKYSYTLDMLLGYTYAASWHELCHCIWVMCYKFCNRIALGRRQTETVLPICEEVNDWESLAEDKTWCTKQPRMESAHTHEGVCLLVICCERFVPFPTHLLYESGESQVQLTASRQLLAKDMRGQNLELDFSDTVSKFTTTVLYPKILSCKVLPWWHPDFRKFVK